MRDVRREKGILIASADQCSGINMCGHAELVFISSAPVFVRCKMCKQNLGATEFEAPNMCVLRVPFAQPCACGSSEVEFSPVPFVPEPEP